MKTLKRIPHLLALAFLLWGTTANATLFSFDLQGTAGFGLLPGNENPATTGGTGGELGSGILYNDATFVLTIHIGWGSGNGFINLTGTATAGHIHGPTTSGGVAAFTQDAPPNYFLDTLGSWNPSPSTGGVNDTVTIAPGDDAALKNGQFYINIHTPTNGGGEIRGYLVNPTVVPEPATFGMLISGLIALSLIRRRNS